MPHGASGKGSELEPTVELDLQDERGGRLHSLELRSLCTQEDYERCEALERETWGQALAVPSSLLMVSQKVGGVTAGAFDQQGGLVGMVYGLTGPQGGRLVHWSHMLAVKPELQGLGLGRELKLFQRRLVRRLGVEIMLWTYDPLVARNAHLNINRLGALPIDYLEDLYGAESDSRLHRGIGTDRFVVQWRLDDEPSGSPVSESGWRDAPSVNTSLDGAPRVGDFELPRRARIRIEVPLDIQQRKLDSPNAGSLWRACTRRAIQGYFRQDYRVVGFLRDAESGRCFYLLRESDRR